MSLSPLYKACRNGDLDTVEQLLPTLTLDEVNQIEPNGSTSLHAACYFNRPQIVKLLLDYGALRTTVNKHGCTAFDEAATEQVKDLFPRPFSAAQARFSSTILLEQAIEWASSNYGPYGWRNKKVIDENNISKAVEDIMKDERFCDVSTTHKIEYFLHKSRQTQDPKWLVQAYSAEMSFCQLINRALAQTPVLESLEKEDNIHAFVGVLFHHDAFKKYRYIGKCYRGMKLSTEDFEKNYEVGQVLLIKPFTSTSKCRNIAEQFAMAPSNSARPLSILCIYTIPERTLAYEDSVVLDISSLSEYPHEQEVLILPYTSLKILSINHLPSGLIEVGLGWYSFQHDGVR